MSGRTTKRVQCPGCGQLLRPSRDMLLGRGGFGCECGFGLELPPPPTLEVVPPPRKPRVLAAGAAGAAGLAGGVALAFAGASTQGGLVLLLGAGFLCRSLWLWWRRRRWFDSAGLCEDPSIRRALLQQLRDLLGGPDGNAERVAQVFLAERGVQAPEFQAALFAEWRRTAEPEA